MEMSDLQGRKALIVVSSGGHLLEAMYLARKLKLSESSIVVTHENAQSKSLLENKPHEFVRAIKSRDLKGAIAAIPIIMKIARRSDFDLIISTGAAIAISAIPVHIFLNKPFFYFESLTRIESPSMTGRLLELFPTVRKFSAASERFNKKWHPSPSILEDFHVRVQEKKSEKFRILVSLGTIPNYRFDRLINSVLQITEDGDNIFWQLGSTTRSELPGEIYETIPNSKLIEIAKNCDIVISHCGIGTILDLLASGVRPIVLPRLAVYDEHVDNHQLEAISKFQEFDLVQILRDLPSREELVTASQKYVSLNIL